MHDSCVVYYHALKSSAINLGYLGVKTCQVFPCFVAIVRVRRYDVDLFVFFVLRHW